MVNTKQKPIVDTQNIMRKETKHTVTESHQTTKVETKRRRKEQRNYKATKNQLSK